MDPVFSFAKYLGTVLLNGFGIAGSILTVLDIVRRAAPGHHWSKAAGRAPISWVAAGCLVLASFQVWVSKNDEVARLQAASDENLGIVRDLKARLAWIESNQPPPARHLTSSQRAAIADVLRASSTGTVTISWLGTDAECEAFAAEFRAVFEQNDWKVTLLAIFQDDAPFHVPMNMTGRGGDPSSRTVVAALRAAGFVAPDNGLEPIPLPGDLPVIFVGSRWTPQARTAD